MVLGLCQYADPRVHQLTSKPTYRNQYNENVYIPFWTISCRHLDSWQVRGNWTDERRKKGHQIPTVRTFFHHFLPVTPYLYIIPAFIVLKLFLGCHSPLPC